MSREIKFRGKSKKTGEWLYGGLINNIFFNRESKVPVCYIMDCTKIGDYDCFEDIVDYFDNLEVDPKTVDQFTETKDTNGTDIYENDKVKNDNGKFREVGFNDRRSQFGLYGRVFDCWITNELLSDGWEVIGNIHGEDL